MVDLRVDALDASASDWRSGRVVEVARLDAASHRFLVKIDLPQTSGLRSGLFGRARFSGPSARALTVPASALVPRGQLTFVFLVDADGTARLRPVSPGAQDGTRVEVLAGLHDGDQIVTQPPPSLVDGARVTRGGQ